MARFHHCHLNKWWMLAMIKIINYSLFIALSIWCGYVLAICIGLMDNPFISGVL